MTYFPPLTIDGQAIRLAHLEPFTLAFPVNRLAGRTLSIDVKFTNHCYTGTFIAGLHDPAHIVMDRGAHRVFDPQRHHLSLQLPTIIRGLPDQSVHITRPGRNYVYMSKLNVAGAIYAVFFHVERARKPNDLTMMVESAYPIESRQETLRGTTKISFAVLCARIFQGEKIISHARR